MSLCEGASRRRRGRRALRWPVAAPGAAAMVAAGCGDELSRRLGLPVVGSMGKVSGVTGESGGAPIQIEDRRLGDVYRDEVLRLESPN